MPEQNKGEPSWPRKNWAILYEHAYNSYMSCVDALSEASRNGVWPSQRTLEREEKALNELTYRRQCLLDALFTYSRRETYVEAGR